MFRTILAALAFFVVTPIFAADATLTWDVVATDTDGNPVTGVKYQVYRARDGARIAAGLTLPTFFVGGYLAGDGCWFVTAVHATLGESTPSATACKEPSSSGKMATPQNLRVK